MPKKEIYDLPALFEAVQLNSIFGRWKNFCGLHSEMQPGRVGRKIP